MHARRARATAAAAPGGETPGCGEHADSCSGELRKTVLAGWGHPPRRRGGQRATAVSGMQQLRLRSRQPALATLAANHKDRPMFFFSIPGLRTRRYITPSPVLLTSALPRQPSWMVGAALPLPTASQLGRPRAAAVLHTPHQTQLASMSRRSPPAAAAHAAGAAVAAAAAAALLLLACAPLVAAAAAAAAAPPLEQLSDERVVFQTAWGDIEFAFLPQVAPVTVQHIFKLVALGAYAGNHIFRVDKGFVAQVADVVGGRTYPLNSAQQTEGDKKVPLEVKQGVKHKEGVLSMGRYDDPDSGASSFSFLLGDAPHLDMQYTIFGKVTSGLDVLHKLEGLETRREGIFVMPKERVAITSTYWYYASHPFVIGMAGAESNPGGTTGLGSSHCDHLQDELDSLRHRFNWQAEELQRVRHKCLPGT